MAVTTSQDYKDVIYTGGAEHDLKLWVNDVLQDNIQEQIEEISRIARVFPNGNDTFTINELITQEVDIILHDVPYNTLTTGQIKFSIGTYIESQEDFEYVPMGIFNIAEVEDNENNRITLKLKDNSIKLDKPYNAKPLIDESGGTATLQEILEDICTFCGITTKITSFPHNDMEIGIYDNTINARIYINYIAGQAGAIPIIDREGELDFIYVNNLTIHKIPLDILQGYSLGEPFEISKVLFELGEIVFESGDETKNTMFIDSGNVYISNQEQIDDIYNIVNGFKIDSVTTDNMLGDPAIDAWDLIQVYGYYDENDNFIDDDSVIVFTTFANQNFIYAGSILASYETKINKEKRDVNTTVTGDELFKKSIKQEIDLVNGRINTTITEINDVDSRVLTLEESAESFNIEVVNERIQNATNELQEQINDTNEATQTNASNIATLEGTIREMNFNFSTAGLNIGSLGDDVSSTLNNQGLKIYNLSTLIAIFNKNGAGVNKLIAIDSIQLQNLLLKKRSITWTNPFTSTSETIDVVSGFWLKDLIEDLHDLEG
jgi:hypothetical protein